MYTAHRDGRFEYVWEIMRFIEDRQCTTCVFRKKPEDWGVQFAADYPMCPEIEAPLSLEEPVEEIDDLGDDGPTCRKYQDAN